MNLPGWLDDEVTCRVAWSRLADPGDTKAHDFVTEHGFSLALQQILGTSRDPVAQELRHRWAARIEHLEPRRDAHNAHLIGARIVVPGCPEWPPGLESLQARAPACLWGKGEGVVDWDRSIAIVGARASTTYGNRLAADLASGVADRGGTVVSGGAFGIDAAAHRAALAVGGTTVAILAGGLDRLYPKGNEALLTEIGVNHLLLSEAPPGTSPTRWRFLERNRLIAAATRATIVVEAAWRSGALNTAGYAAELGRPLGAVPGPVTSASSAGCHRLLRDQHAVCITDAAEAWELAVGQLAESPDQGSFLFHPSDPVDLRVYDEMTIGRPYTVTALAGRTALSGDLVLAALGRLSLSGLVVRRDTGWARLSGNRPDRRAS